MTLLKRSVMTLYSGPMDIYSHQARIVLAEKGVSVDVLNVDPSQPNENLMELNPYGTLPTLLDRELVLYNAKIIMEYLDERFPHPPLLPVYPVARAKSRLMIYRIERDWYSLLDDIQSEDPVVSKKACDSLRDGLVTLLPVFQEMPYFLSEDFSLIDCCIAPLLWRLPAYGIELPNNAKAIFKYAERLFERESFQASLTEVERELREHI